MIYQYIKALHIIFVVTWFSGLFYVVRLFIYTVEAHEAEEPARSILIKNLTRWTKLLWYGITWPSAVITLLFGSYFLYFYAGNMPSWLWLKLCFVAGLYAYHIICHAIFKQLQKEIFRYSSQQLRIWNEVATIFLFSIVFIVILKNALSMLWGLLGLAVFTIILMLAIKIYKNIRKKGESANT